MDYQSYFDRPLHKRTHDALVRELAPFGFSEDLIWSIYHRLNGREALAETYLNVFLAEQEAMRKQMVMAGPEAKPEAEPEARGFEESKEEAIECIECPSITPISPR